MEDSYDGEVIEFLDGLTFNEGASVKYNLPESGCCLSEASSSAFRKIIFRACGVIFADLFRSW